MTHFKEYWNGTNAHPFITIYGVIYNAINLGFDTSMSPEAIIEILYSKGGLQQLSLLDGKYVIVIRQAELTHIIRDHHGIGVPVYYNEQAFASSLQLLLEASTTTPQPNTAALCEFLAKGYIHTPQSSLQGINRLGAGEALTRAKGQLTTTPLFPLICSTPSNRNTVIGLEACSYKSLHLHAITSRIAGAESVGILLSGGYDSGSNLAALRDVYSGTIDSFSIGFKGDNWSELPLTRIMSQRFGTNHHEYEIDGSEILELPTIVKALGDPFVEGGTLVNYTAMKMVSDNKPDIILGGDANDQYFGTTGREIAIHYLLSRAYLMPITKGIFSTLLGPKSEQKEFIFRLRFHLDKIINILEGDQFGFSESDIKKLVLRHNYSRAHSTIRSNTQSFAALFEQHRILSDIDKISNHVILHKASRMADLFDVNISFPFTDLSIYNYLRTLPTSLKCQGRSALDIARGRTTSKYLLKHTYKELLPEEITSKRKQGGFAPMPLFFNDDKRRALLADFILSSSVCDDFFNRTQVEAFINQYNKINSENNHWFWFRQYKAIQFYNLLTLAVWWETFINNNDQVSF